MKKLSIFFSILILLIFSVNLEARKKKYPNGDYYEGKWRKGAPHGKGIMKYANGDTYVGNWAHGKYSGEGEKTYRSGEIYKYTGNWENSLQHGYGTMHFYNGNVYKGQFNMSKISGEGEMTYRNDDIYTGTWNNGLRSGNGKLVCKNGNLYEGTWKNDAFYQGKATIDNIIYEGEFSDGYIVKGKQTGPNNSWYEGEWKDQVFYTGKCRGNIGDAYYEGVWENGVFTNGKCNGTINKMYYDGTWENGIFTGLYKGYKNNDYYNGKLTNGTFTGECILKNPAKNIVEFNGERLADSSYVGWITFTDGVFQGKFSDDFKQQGEGSIKLGKKDKLELNGTWNDNRIINGTGKIICNSQEYQTTITSTENIRKIDLIESTTNKKKSLEIPDSVSSDSILLDWVCSTINQETQIIINQENKILKKTLYDKYNDKGFVYVEDPYTPFLPFTKAVKFYRIITFGSSEKINLAVIPFLDKDMLLDMGRDNAVMAYAFASKGLKNEFYPFEVINNTITFDNQKFEYNPTNKSLKDENGKIYKLMQTNKLKKIIENGVNSLNLFK